MTITEVTVVCACAAVVFTCGFAVGYAVRSALEWVVRHRS